MTIWCGMSGSLKRSWGYIEGIQFGRGWSGRRVSIDGQVQGGRPGRGPPAERGDASHTYGYKLEADDFG